MNIIVSKKFAKSFKKLPQKKQDKARQAIKDFLCDSSLPHLRLHVLKGRFNGIQSISAGGDLRIHLHVVIIEDECILLDIGSHSQLYG